MDNIFDIYEYIEQTLIVVYYATCKNLMAYIVNHIFPKTFLSILFVAEILIYITLQVA